MTNTKYKQCRYLCKVLLLVFCLGVLTQCKKKKEEEPPAQTQTPQPVQDTAKQSCIDATAAAFIATDIDMIVAQSSEYSYMMFYSHTFTATSNNSVTVIRDTMSRKSYLLFNNAQGYDGIVRNGTLTINYASNSSSVTASSNQVYIRQPGHMSVVSFSNFSVGKFAIQNSSSLVVKNTTPANYTRSVTPLTWSIEGSLKFADTTNGGGNNTIDMTWNGQFMKTLTNSTTNTIHPSITLPIRWITGVPGVPTSTAQYSSNHALDPNGKNSIVTYTGSATGVTSGTVNYQFNIQSANPLYRDFGCSPAFYTSPEHHPFIKGIVDFKPADKDWRTIYFTDAANLLSNCDNIGSVSIGGVYFALNFLQ